MIDNYVDEQDNLAEEYNDTVCNKTVIMKLETLDDSADLLASWVTKKLDSLGVFSSVGRILSRK